jgi:ATP-dependent DNA helicase RecG
LEEDAMLMDNELLALLVDIESDRVERTTSVDKTDKHCEAICAFANDFPANRMPGYLMLGVNPDGRLGGLKVTDQLLQNLAAHRSNGSILPQPAMTVQKHSLPEGDVAVAEVHPSDLPPVRYKGQVWIGSAQHGESLTSRKSVS